FLYVSPQQITGHVICNRRIVDDPVTSRFVAIKPDHRQFPQVPCAASDIFWELHDAGAVSVFKSVYLLMSSSHLSLQNQHFSASFLKGKAEGFSPQPSRSSSSSSQTSNSSSGR